MDASSLAQYYPTYFNNKEYRALLVGQYGSILYPNKDIQLGSLAELCHLSDTANINKSDQLFFYIPSPDPGQFFTKGILENIRLKIKETNSNLLIIDTNLMSRQLSNLQAHLGVQVIGRVELILDIFAMRAKTKTAALQVELAKLVYILPRLKGLGDVLSRLGGGIGTRGPGETMLEADRRHIRRRIRKIRSSLQKVSKHHQNIRKNRFLPVVALVGYTNAGKTTLLNQLSSSPRKLFAEDRLFATLDSHSRRIYLGEMNYRPVYGIVTDTIGFICNLPAKLIAAFSSTLEEIYHTDAIIIVADSSSSKLEEELFVVEKELKKLNVSNKERILFLNKADKISAREKKEWIKKYPYAILGSANSKKGILELRKNLFFMLQKRNILKTSNTEQLDLSPSIKDGTPGRVSMQLEDG